MSWALACARWPGGLEQADLEHLAGVVPLVHRVVDVEPFVALQADQVALGVRRVFWRPRSCRRRPPPRAGAAGRARARGRYGGRQRAVRDVVARAEFVGQRLDRARPGWTVLAVLGEVALLALLGKVGHRPKDADTDRPADGAPGSARSGQTSRSLDQRVDLGDGPIDLALTLPLLGCLLLRGTLECGCFSPTVRCNSAIRSLKWGAQLAGASRPAGSSAGPPPGSGSPRSGHRGTSCAC